tara:strand:- start:5237 stop:5611 length:375 start_codon:yes stop_codon:yes gene_type:complete
MIDQSKRVQVYFNLHKRVWSVRQSGLVVDHADCIVLRDVRFLVGKAGRENVRKQKKKNVHAYASGYVCQLEDLPIIPERINAVTYNPYKHETFVYVDNGKPCLTANFVEMQVVNKKPIVEGIWK